MGYINKIKIGSETYDVSSKISDGLSRKNDGSIYVSTSSGLTFDMDKNYALTIKTGSGLTFDSSNNLCWGYTLGSGIFLEKNMLGLKTKNNGISITEDNYFSLDEKVMQYKEKKNYADSTEFNMNNFTTEGIYKIHVDSRTATYDNLPITNTGGGHTVDGELTVLNASLPDNSETLLTQKLILANRLGGEGKEYIRSRNNGTWTPWLTNQTMREVGTTTSFDDYIQNGMYSGVYVGSSENDKIGSSHSGDCHYHVYETFVIITIDNYAVHQMSGGQYPNMITQFKYALTPTDGPSFNVRYGVYDTSSSSVNWNGWEMIHGPFHPGTV